MIRKANKLERHYLTNIEEYKENSLIDEILKVKEIASERLNKIVTLFYTIRDNYINIYMNGMYVKLTLKNGDVYLTPTKSNPSENSTKALELREIFKGFDTEHIKTINEFREVMIKYFEAYLKYQEIHPMNEKVYQHILTHTINDFKLLQNYGNIDIIDAELYIYLTELKEQGNVRGKVDLVGVSSTGKLLYIEVKIDGSVILGSNGVNKHCYDIREYTNPLHRYTKDDINTWTQQINYLFDRNIALITDEIPDFIIICGYHYAEKYDVVDQLAEISSEEMVRTLRDYPNIVSVNDNPEELKTIYGHFQDLKDIGVIPRLLVAEVDDDYKLIDECDIGYIATKEYAGKCFHEIRTSIINYIKRQMKK